jgi:hypothetical protein
MNARRTEQPTAPQQLGLLLLLVAFLVYVFIRLSV